MLWLSGCFLMLFGISELLFHVAKVQVEISRKVSHIGTGFLTMLFPVWLHSHWSVLILCTSFLAILVLSQQFGLLRSINGISRKSYGSMSYPIIVYFCFLASSSLQTSQFGDHNYSFFYLPILTMALADPAAAFVGMRWPIGIYTIGIDKKSASGSFAFFSVAFGLAFVFLFHCKLLEQMTIVHRMVLIHFEYWFLLL